MIDWEDMLLTAQRGLGWLPQQFWDSTIYEFETAILSVVRQNEPEAWSDDQTREFFDRLSPGPQGAIAPAAFS